MPIEIACRCGKKFAAPEKLAGKTLSCPECGGPLTVPDPRQKTAAAATPPPIKATCTCGKSFSAKSSLAGKTVKCPSCGQALKIPAATSKTVREQPPATAAAPGIADLLDDVGVTASKTGARCPECGADMAPEAILCIACGFHVESGKRLQTKRVGKPPKTE